MFCMHSACLCVWKRKVKNGGYERDKTFINLTHSSMNRCQFKARLKGAYILSISTRTVAKLVNTPCHTLAISVWSQLAIWIHHCWSKSWAFTPQHIIIYPPPAKKIVLFGSHTQNTARIIKKSQTKNIKRLQGVTVQNFISAMAKIQQFQKMNNKLLWTLEMNISAEILTFSCLPKTGKEPSDFTSYCLKLHRIAFVVKMNHTKDFIPVHRMISILPSTGKTGH